MVKFNKITDKSFDASAAFTILLNAPWSEHNFNCFGAERYLTLVNKLRNDRNHWGHARLHEFTTQKYHMAIQRMIDLLNSWPSYVLDSDSPSKLEAIKKLKKWKENSLQQGTFVKLEVLKLILKEFKVESENNKKLANKVEKEEYFTFKSFILKEFKKYTENYLKLADKNVDKEDFIALKSSIETQLAEIPMLKRNLEKIETRVEDLEDNRKKESNPKDVSNLPSRKNNFCGRGEKLEEIENLLLADTEEKNNKVVAILGVGGIGKTSVALQIGNRLKDKFNGGTFWLTADDDKKLTNNLFEIAMILDERIDPNIAHNGDILVNIVINFIFKQTQKSLIIIDNLDNDNFPSLANKIINGRLLENSKVTILITSRIQKDYLKPRIKSSNCAFINVDCLSLKEGIHFMKAKLESEDINQEVAEEIVDTLGIASLTLGPNVEDKIEVGIESTENKINKISALKVINELGGLPLALEQFTLYINILPFEGRNLQKHLKRLQAKKLEYCEINAEGETTDLDPNRLNVKTTWLMNKEALTNENPRFEMILDVLSFLNPTCIPTLILEANIPGLPLLGDEQLIIHKLKKYSFFSIADKERLIVHVHRMIQEVIKDIVIEEGRLKQTLQNVDITLDFLFEQEREASISKAIATQNGQHFLYELETFFGRNILDEEWLEKQIKKTNTQQIMCLSNVRPNTTDSEVIHSIFKRPSFKNLRVHTFW